MIEKILAFLNAIPADKVAHCLGGVILFAIGQLFGYGLFLAISVGFLKEVYDYFHQDKHTPDVWDWVATSLGGVLGTVCGMGVLG